MSTRELIEIIEALKKYYNQEVVMISNIQDFKNTIIIETLSEGDVFVWNREKKILELE